MLPFVTVGFKVLFCPISEDQGYPIIVTCPCTSIVEESPSIRLESNLPVVGVILSIAMSLWSDVLFAVTSTLKKLLPIGPSGFEATAVLNWTVTSTAYGLP